MTQAKNISKASSYFFLIGFIVSKIQYLPIVFVSIIPNVISLVCYFMAYGLWFISSHFLDSNKPNKEEWYGFAQFKEQFLYAATIGIIASLISISSLFLPVLIVPATWLFCTSNILWSIGEYNKLKHPSESDINFSYSYQQTYLSYALTMTAIAFTTALGATLIFIFPPITMPILIISTITSSGLGILSCDYWLDYTFGDHKTTSPVNQSYHQMSDSLGSALSNQHNDSAEPYHGEALLKSPPTIPANNETKEPDLSIQSCTPSQ
ncbi:hypothetical protein [Legionella quateirensis]|uniref:Transmembrane protein n=1 Tax=Legionella quateirensis TaxID=45072 RepID=A0A378KSY0_9GAMM|nr:hypothetical protein [Legionella quateirensis]KTD50791.1 hypothetical protein Lqua_1018 [Legionella quateirensis]STY17964.1 Uncharacterised protein [Legionella quateirensis]